MTYLNTNQNPSLTRSARRHVNVLRVSIALVVALASGTTSYAQDLDLNNAFPQDESERALNVLSFKFNNTGVVGNSVRLLQSQSKFDFESKSRLSGQGILSPKGKNSNSLLDSRLKASGSLNGVQSLQSASNYTLEAGLDKYLPSKRGPSYQAPKATTLVADTSWYIKEDSFQYAELVNPKSSISRQSTALLP